MIKTPPKLVNLQAIDCQWALTFHFEAKRQRYKETVETLNIYLRQWQLKEACRVLSRWLKYKAELELTPWLRSVSRRCGLPFQQVLYRGQKTVWGTCSHDGRICLNYKLLFLPSDYVEYVLIHELCHTIHLDHSPRFWHLVSDFVPNWKGLRREVRRADLYLPDWLKGGSR